MIDIAACTSCSTLNKRTEWIFSVGYEYTRSHRSVKSLMARSADDIYSVRQTERYYPCRLCAVRNKTDIVLSAKLCDFNKRSYSAVYITACGYNDHGSVTADKPLKRRNQFAIAFAAVCYAVIYPLLFI